MTKRHNHDDRDVEIAVEAVKSNFNWVNKVLAVGVTVLGTIVLLKLLGTDKITWQGITIGTSQGWLAVLLFTIAHLYSSILLIGSLRSLWHNSSKQDRRQLLKEISSTGGIFIRGLVVRTKIIDLMKPPDKGQDLYIRYRMDVRDPSTWTSHLAIPIVVLAVVPFELNMSLVLMIPLAIAFAEINWVIGSHWVVALSDLRTKKQNSAYFTEIDESGLSVVVIASEAGDMAFGSIPFPFVLVWLSLQGIVLLVMTPIKVAFVAYWFVRYKLLSRVLDNRAN